MDRTAGAACHRREATPARLTQGGMISTMRTARPTTGSPLPVPEAGTAPFDPVCSRFCFFRRLDPADPFIAGEGCNVPPRRQRFCVGVQRFFQVRGQVMDHAAWNRFLSHEGYRQSDVLVGDGLELLQGQNLTNPPKTRASRVTSWKRAAPASRWPGPAMQKRKRNAEVFSGCRGAARRD
jgi:hypothetical protein